MTSSEPDSFELEMDEQSRIGSEFMARVNNEIRRAMALEKSSRKITQQAIAEKIGTSRHVVNRQVQGMENLGARRIAELLWAIGWEPYFEARKIPERDNQFCMQKSSASAVNDRPSPVPPQKTERIVGVPDQQMLKNLWGGIVNKPAPVPVS
jgi:hypothetical protein